MERYCDQVVFVREESLQHPSYQEVLERLMRSGVIRRPSFLPTLNAFERALKMVDLNDFDLIWVEKQGLLPLLKAHYEKIIVDFDDVAHIKHLREARMRLPSRMGFLALQRGVRCIYTETIGAKRFLSCIVCSDEDRRYLNAYGARNIHAIPNGVNIPDVSLPSVHNSPGGPRLVFLGNMEYDPNIDAMQFFCKEVAPLLRGALPEFELDVIGPGASPEMRRSYEKQIQFLGFVDDLPATLRRYNIFVAPIRFGSGTKLKLLDAMANKVPIVTTRVGAEGLQLEHRKSALLAETPSDIASSIIELHRNQTLAAELAENAFSVAHNSFRWESIRERAADWILSQELSYKLRLKGSQIAM